MVKYYGHIPDNACEGSNDRYIRIYTSLDTLLAEEELADDEIITEFSQGKQYTVTVKRVKTYIKKGKP